MRKSADADQTAVADLAQELAAPVVSIAHVTDVIGYLQKYGCRVRRFTGVCTTIPGSTVFYGSLELTFSLAAKNAFADSEPACLPISRWALFEIAAHELNNLPSTKVIKTLAKTVGRLPGSGSVSELARAICSQLGLDAVQAAAPRLVNDLFRPAKRHQQRVGRIRIALNKG